MTFGNFTQHCRKLCHCGKLETCTISGKLFLLWSFCGSCGLQCMQLQSSSNVAQVEIPRLRSTFVVCFCSVLFCVCMLGGTHIRMFSITFFHLSPPFSTSDSVTWLNICLCNLQTTWLKPIAIFAISNDFWMQYTQPPFIWCTHSMS